MPGPSNTLLIEGSFPELSEELAQYLDSLSKVDPSAGIQAEIAPILNALREDEQAEQPSDPESIQKQKDDVLKSIVGKAAVLNGAPEKEFTAAYNLLINLSNQSPMRDRFFMRVCQYLSESPVTSSAQYGASLATATLTTIFNIIPPEDNTRYHVFLAILKIIRATSSAQTFEALVPQLEINVPTWLSAWQLDDEDTRDLHLAIADVAEATGNQDTCYHYLLKALETIEPSSASEPESRNLAKRTLISALTNPTVTDFTAITVSDAIQALRQSDPPLLELLDIFSSDDYASYNDFLETTPLSSLSIPDDAAEAMSTKIRLLTLATIAASTTSRSVPYSAIASALQIPSEDVEMWVIDTIRAGLIEGKLSQLKQELLVQRATYRVFGEKQWAEIQGRLMVWRRSLESVLGAVRAERERFLREGPGQSYADAQDGGGFDSQQGGGGGGRGGRQNGYQGDQRRRGGDRRGQQREPREHREPREIDFVRREEVVE